MTGRLAPPSIPGWEIVQHIGAGGMGDVWKARRADGVVAAIKVAKPVRGLASGEVASFFRREALACLHVDHPNLVRALDAGTTGDGRAFLALEFVEGRTLDAVIADGGALPQVRVVEIGIALANALAHVSRMNLVHRDVKPRNVMLAAGGGVKLLDFGLVVETTEGRDGHGMGTYGFVAPEILAGRTGGPRSDFYALGATLAAAVTGEMPTRERSFADSALPQAVGGRTLSPGFRQVVARLLKSDPAARYGSAAEIVLDLEAVAAGDRPLGAILGTTGSRAVRRAPKIAAATAIVAAVAAGAWWISARRADGPDAATAASPFDTPHAASRDPKLEAAEVFMESFPDDIVRGRALIAEADTPALSDADRADLDRLREECDRRFAAAAEREYAERDRRLKTALDAGDVPQARQIAAGWPDAFRGSPMALRLTHTAETAAARLVAENQGLAKEADRVAAAPGPADGTARDVAPLEALIARIDSALARPAFDDDARDRLVAARLRLEEIRTAAAGARVAATALSRWREALAQHAAAPSAEHLRAALEAASDDALPAQTRDDASAFAAAWKAAEARLALRVSALKGKRWCGPRGGSLFCGVVERVPSVDDVFLSPLWTPSGGRVAAIAEGTSGTGDAAAWLFARGLWDEARAASGTAGAVTAWLAEGPHAAPAARADAAWPAGIDLDLALRDVGSSAPSRSAGDPIVAAWAAATDPKGRPAVFAARNPDKAAGRDAFLADDLAKAVASLTAAATVDPRDAEIAALRGRAYLVGARPMPTAPALLAAFSEGRRAWDLDPKLPAGPVLAADAGIAFVEVAGAAAAVRVRAIAAAACEAADALGRADARMLLFAGEHRLDAGRAADAAALLRRAAADLSNSGPAALLLARAEHACGRDDKAREALRRARDLLGGTLPESAADLARALGL